MLDKYKNLAIFVTTHEESRAVQDALFSSGVKWPNKHTHYVEIAYVPKAVILVSDDHTMTYASIEHFECYDQTNYQDLVKISYEEFLEIAWSPNKKPAKTPMKAMSLYATNLNTLYKSIAKVGGNPATVLDKHQELLETFARNGLEISFNIHSDMGGL